MVQVTPMDGGVTLRAAIGTDGARHAGQLMQAGLGTPGDTSFAFEGSRLVATRTLIEPMLGAMYDAIFDLAKSTCLLSRYLANSSPMMRRLLRHLLCRVPRRGRRRRLAPPRHDREPHPPGRPLLRRLRDPHHPAPPPRPAPAAAPWRATHRVGAQGATVYVAPGDAQPVGRLDPWLDAMVIEESQSGWAHVVCSNTWSTWIDRRALQPTQ